MAVEKLTTNLGTNTDLSSEFLYHLRMIKNRIIPKIREASKAIITGISQTGKQSVRELAKRIGRSKSSAHRHLKAIKKRDQHPESSRRETEAGSAWLRLMFFSTLYQFGLKSRVG